MLGASVAVALACCLVLAAIGLVFPLLTGGHPSLGADLLLGAEAECTGGCLAVAVGLLCSRLVIRRSGYALLVTLGLLLVLLLVPPVNPLLRLLASGQPADHLLGRVSVLLGVGVVLLAMKRHARRVRLRSPGITLGEQLWGTTMFLRIRRLRLIFRPWRVRRG